MDEYNRILQNEYGIVANKVFPITGGWSALAYKIESENGTFFLKVYEKQKILTDSQLKKLDLCMNVVSWLERNTALQGKINTPVLTKRSDVMVETQDYSYLLFSYIDGITPQTTPLTISQQKELAEISGELHRHGTDIPFDLSSIQETYEIPCAELSSMKYNLNDSLCVHRHYDMIMRAIEQAHNMAERVKSIGLPHVLCHTDIHGWNLIQSSRLVLIDWESIKLAPAEADLYTFWGDWYWGDSKWGSYWETFLPIYQQLCPWYIVNEDNLRFYQIRRHIEDINDFYRQYLYDDMTENETNEVISCLERECRFLDTLL